MLSSSDTGHMHKRAHTAVQAIRPKPFNIKVFKQVQKRHMRPKRLRSDHFQVYESNYITYA